MMHEMYSTHWHVDPRSRTVIAARVRGVLVGACALSTSIRLTSGSVARRRRKGAVGVGRSLSCGAASAHKNFCENNSQGSPSGVSNEWMDTVIFPVESV